MSQPTTDQILARLRDGALDSLVELCLDDLLERPVVPGLLRPETVAQRAVSVLRATAASPRLEPWLRDQLEELRARTIEPDASGRAHSPGATLRDHVPAELSAPLEELLTEPWLPDRALVLRLLDHEAMHSLIHEVLHAALTRFAKKMRSLKPDTSKLRSGLGKRVPGSLSRLKDIGSGVVSVVGSEIESQLDQRVGEFVSQAISAVLGHVATLLTAPERAETMGDWRAYGLRVLLDTELEAWAVEARKLDPERAVQAMAKALRALAGRDTLEAELTDLIGVALDPWREQRIGELLRELGIEEAWREAGRSQLVELLGPVLDTTAFHAWLHALLGTADQS
jgi:hypothetical protein